MSSLYVGADLHAGNHRILGGPFINGRNRRCDEVVDVLMAVCKFVDQRGGVLVLAGDVFDIANPTPQLVRAVQDAVEPLTGNPEQPGIVVMAGNHDRVSAEPGDHALGPLGALPGVIVVDAPEMIDIGGEPTFFCPPAPRGRVFTDWLDEALTGQRPTRLVIHAGIEDGNTQDFLRGSTQAIDVLRLATIAREHGITEVFAGDWHEHKVWGVDSVRIVQCGALVPTGWDNPGPNYGRVAEAGTGRIWTFPGPRFFDASTEAEAEALLRREFKNGKLRDISYVRLQVPAQDRESTLARLEAIASEHDAHVIVTAEQQGGDGAEVRERVFGGVDAAMVEVVAGMGLDDDARDAVLARSRQYYAAATR